MASDTESDGSIPLPDLSNSRDVGLLTGLEDELAADLRSANQSSEDEAVWDGTRPKITIKPRNNPMDKKPRASIHRKRKNTTKANNRPIQNSRLLLLPQELKDMVVDSVRSLQDLSYLSKTCLDLRETVLPFLFRDINIEVSEDRGLHLLRTISELGDHQRFAHMIRTFKLRIIRCRLRSCSLVLELIQAAPKLRRLEIHYQLDQSQGSGSHCDNVDGNALSSALTSVKDTLEHLKISYEFEIDGGEFAQPTTSGFCSLQQLHRLRTADIPFFLLLGWYPDEAPALADVLPRSLSALRFGDEDWWGDRVEWSEDLMMRKLVEYFRAEGWKETTPDLKNVVLSLWSFHEVRGNYYREWLRDGGERNFKRLCAENGLQCEVVRYPDSF